MFLTQHPTGQNMAQAKNMEQVTNKKIQGLVDEIEQCLTKSAESIDDLKKKVSELNMERQKLISCLFRLTHHQVGPFNRCFVFMHTQRRSKDKSMHLK